MHDVMLDIETLGTEPGAPIVAIGALRFDRDAKDLSDAEPFYRVLSMAGGHLLVDTKTLCWWMLQGDQARNAIFGESAQQSAVGRAVMLTDLSNFLSTREVRRLWSNGPMFDERMIREAVRGLDLELPGYRTSRCCRTKYDDARTWWGNDCERRLAEAAIRRIPKIGHLSKHHALGDCWRQASAIQEIHQYGNSVTG
jgi:hypothetical protein